VYGYKVMLHSLVTMNVFVSKLCHNIFYPTPVVSFFFIITSDINISFTT
jgi:hypothetical protein